MLLWKDCFFKNCAASSAAAIDAKTWHRLVIIIIIIQRAKARIVSVMRDYVKHSLKICIIFMKQEGKLAKSGGKIFVQVIFIVMMLL